MAPTRIANSTAPAENVLSVSLELASISWKIALQDWQRDKPAICNVKAEVAQDRLQEVIDTIDQFKARWQLDEDVRVVVLYEAGQDGFWIAPALIKKGIEALVCDPASIPVERQARRAKTDRLDAIRLVSALRGWLRGERDRMKVIAMPSVDAEAQRHLMRDRGTLQKEVNQHRDRISKLLRTVGCWDVMTADAPLRAP